MTAATRAGDRDQRPHVQLGGAQQRPDTVIEPVHHALGQHREHAHAPDTTASSTALAGPDQTRAPTTHSTSAGPSTAITAVQVSNEARDCPAVGLPTVTMTATVAASSAAHIHSQRVTRGASAAR